jgi:hypothetical protein
VLKGTKVLSPRLCDSALLRLGLSLADLIATQRRGACPSASGAPHATLQLLAGQVGPGCPWPAGSPFRLERFLISPGEVEKMTCPVAARLAADHAMWPAFSAGDYVVLDQGVSARTQTDASCLYLVRLKNQALIRMIRRGSGGIYLVTERNRSTPAKWTRIPLSHTEYPSVIRARARIVVPCVTWQSSSPDR